MAEASGEGKTRQSYRGLLYLHGLTLRILKKK